MNDTNEQTNNPNETNEAENINSDAKANPKKSVDNRWISKFEDLLKVKNLTELKTELTLLASELQTEIQNFNINVHLSPEAQTRLKALEAQYSKVVQSISKAQKQFDREFDKSIRVLKRTRTDAEKQFGQIKTKITKHTQDLAKASGRLRKTIKTKAKTVSKKVNGPKTVRKTKKAKV